MKTRFNPSRRKFIVTSGLVGTGLALGFKVFCSDENRINGDTLKPNVWVSIDSEGRVSITLAKSEMGQGVMTALPMLVADELEVDWETISVIQADAPLEPLLGNQVTGGSGSVRAAWEPLREAGAIVKALLVKAAAKQWSVNESQCTASHGRIHHNGSGKSIGYGELVEVASKLPLPESVALKNPEDFRLIGTNVPRTEGLLHVTGKAKYGTDVQLSGQLTAIVIHCPVFGGSLKSFDDSHAKSINGIRRILEIDSGVAVVADNYWAARKAQELLQIEWNKGQSATISSESIRKKFVDAIENEGVIAQRAGDVGAIFKSRTKIITSDYELPFQAHATMEPMSCTADLSNGKYEVWAPTQSPRHAQEEIMKYGLSDTMSVVEKVKRKLTNKSLRSIKVNTTHLGCGFGRRLQQDYVAEAVQIAREVDAPVRLVWSREEDMQHDFYRPANFNRISAVLDDNGKPVAWRHKIAGPSISDSLWGGINPGEVDHMAVEGAINLPYEIENIEVIWVKVDTPVPIGMWRSVGHSQNAFVVESFMDEMAVHAGHDPLEYRIGLLNNSPHHKRVLELCADKAGWGRSLPDGHFHGVAVHKSYYSYVAHIVEISLEDNANIKVHKVTSAVDCGTVVNPDIVRAQIEGSIVFGLGATLKSEITIKQGRVEQSNFHDNPILRINEMPEVEVHFINSKEPPTGIGEPGVPPVAPAVANAVFSATGKRLRKLPVLVKDFIWPGKHVEIIV